MSKKHQIRINCCSPVANIRLMRGTKCFKEYSWQQQIEKSETLVEKLDAMLKKYDLKMSNCNFWVDELCKNGSYTGHRIAISVINAINYSLGIKKMFQAKYSAKIKNSSIQKLKTDI